MSQVSARMQSLIAEIRSPDSLSKLVEIAKKTGSPPEEEDDSVISGLPYQRLIHLINTGRSYYMFRGFERAGYAAGLIMAIAALDLIFQFVELGRVRSEAWAFFEGLVLVFGALSVLLLIPMAQSASVQDKEEFENAFGPGSLSKESIASLDTAASELRSDVRKAITPEVAGSEQPLSVRIEEFKKIGQSKLERQCGENLYDMIELTPQGIFVWRELRGGLSPRYLLLPYELNWNVLKISVQEGSEVRVGRLVIPVEEVSKLLNFEPR